MTLFRKLREDQRGQDLIEYALLAAFLVAVVPAVLTSGYVGHITALFAKAGDALARILQ